MFLSPSESGSSLENDESNHTVSLEGLPQLCGFVLWSSRISFGAGGRFWRRSDSGSESDACRVRRMKFSYVTRTSMVSLTPTLPIPNILDPSGRREE